MRSYLLVLTVLLLTSCGGLDPGDLPQESSVQGVVSYTGGSSVWPDSVLEVRVVLFDQQPTAPDSVLAAIIGNNAAFTDTLARFVDSSVYSIAIAKPPRTFNYVVVAGRVGPNLLKDWLMLALYADPGTPDVPKALTVLEGAQVSLDFEVDFGNLPSQPY
jgi:hypothetical protein